MMKKKLIIIPVNQFESHWSLMLVVRPDLLYNTFVADIDLSDDTQKTIIIGLDSLTTGISNVAHINILTWLNSLLNGNNQVQLVLDRFNLPILVPSIPYQNNGWDCGVFCMKYVQCLYANTKWYLRTRNTADLRENIEKVFSFDAQSVHDLRVLFRKKLHAYATA